MVWRYGRRLKLVQLVHCTRMGHAISAIVEADTLECRTFSLDIPLRHMSPDIFVAQTISLPT